MTRRIALALALGVLLGCASAAVADFIMPGERARPRIIRAIVCAAHTWVSAVSANDTKTCTQPNVTDVVNAASLTAADQTLSGGANVTANNLGTISSGTTTLDCGASPLQYLTNNGAFTLAAPSNDGSCIVEVTNGASAGTITFSGWTVGSNTGDTYATTNTNKYDLFVRRINGHSSYQWSALQ